MKKDEKDKNITKLSTKISESTNKENVTEPNTINNISKWYKDESNIEQQNDRVKKINTKRKNTTNTHIQSYEENYNYEYSD